MSLSSLLTEAEGDLAKANPLVIVKAIQADIEELKADGASLKAELQELKTVLVAAEPALTSVLTVVYPTGNAIPAEITALLATLPKVATQPGAQQLSGKART